jgi:glycosyltransferase involved in cell wall biosynthesis
MKNLSNQLISLIIPCFNEENTIEKLLEAIRAQTMPLGSLEVIIADGLSTDNTRQIIAEYTKNHTDLKITVIDNDKKVIPAGLNKAIKTAKGNIILRMDAHAYPAPDYIEKSVAALSAGLGDNVGGVIDIRPPKDSWMARSISLATAHPLGVGDAKYRWATKASLVDTVAFGCYYRNIVEKAGYYNESLAANEDYEFNARLRKMGLKIWVDPAIRAVYFSRPDLKSLAKQYYSYGFWKVRMLRMFPDTIRWRQALPPLFVSGILMLLLLSIIWFPAIWFFITAFLLYLLILAVGALKLAFNQKEAALFIGIPLAIMTMHFSWGTGFWMSLLKPGKKEK